MSTTKQVRSTGPGARWRAAGRIERGPAVAGTGCAGGRRGRRASLPRDVRRAVSDRNERRRHPPAQQRARHGYAPAPQASRESRQPRRVTSGLLLRPVPRPRRRASGLAIGGSHVGSAGARERSRLAPGRGRCGTAAGSHGPGAVAARDPWPTNDHGRTERGNRSSVDPFALQPAAAQGGLPVRPRSRSGCAGAARPLSRLPSVLVPLWRPRREASRARARPPAPRRGRATTHAPDPRPQAKAGAPIAALPC
jgi:hypothetical protein